MATSLAKFLDYMTAQSSNNLEIHQAVKEILGLKSDQDRYCLAKRLVADVEINISPIPTSKDAREARAAKELGNKLFGVKNYKDAIKEYSRALLLAPWPTSFSEDGTADDPSLAQIFGNRSAAFFNRGQLVECLADIDRAVEHGYPRSQVRKLLERKCRALMQRKHFEAAVKCFKTDFVDFGAVSKDFFGDPPSGVGDLRKLFEEALAGWKKQKRAGEVPQPFNKSGPGRYESYREQREGLESGVKTWAIESKHTVFHSAIASVDLQYSESKGRHMVASSSIRPGTVVVAERSFVSSVHMEYSSANCYSCLTFTDVPLPCETCSKVMFCSRECSSDPKAAFHKQECAMLGLLQSADLPGIDSSLYVMVVRTLLKKTAGQWREFSESYPGNLTDQASRNFQSIPDKSSYSWDDFRNVFCFSKKLKVAGGKKVLEVALAATYIMQLLKVTHFPQSRGGLDETLEEFLGGLIIRMFFIYSYNSTEARDFICSMNAVFEPNFVDALLYEVETAAVFHPTLELFNNACNGNLMTSHLGDTVVLVAVRPIRVGEELTRIRDCPSSFKDSPLADRRKVIREKMGYVCMCTACVEDWPMKRALVELLNKDRLPVRCPDCSHRFDSFQEMSEAIRRTEKCPCGKSPHIPEHVAMARKRVGERPEIEVFYGAMAAHAMFRAPHPHLIEYESAAYVFVMTRCNGRRFEDAPSWLKQKIPHAGVYIGVGR